MPPFDMSEARLKTIKKLQEENKKLKEENKTIKGGYFKESEFDGEFKRMSKNELIGYCEVLSQIAALREQQIEELKEENKKLKKYENMINGVWSELYWKDKYGEDVGWKDISLCVDYDEDFVKKEVVDDEEE
jgi:hypothetical protein